MSEMKKGRGRPPKPETLERRELESRMEQFFSSAPSRIKQQNSDHLFEWLAGMDRAKDEILHDYLGYRNFTHAHIFNMASLGHELLSGHEHVILEEDSRLHQDAGGYRDTGGKVREKDATANAVALCQKNRILLERVKPLGPLSPTSAAKIIRSQWSHIPPESRTPAEKGLDCRGVVWAGKKDGHVPSIKTIVRAIEKESPFLQHRKRQSSGPKK